MGELRYKPYGETRTSAGSIPTDYRYTGQRQEESLGLYQMGARWVDPALSRWLSADTIVPEPGNPQAFNRYSYVDSNPLRFVDPTGHFTDDEIKQYLQNTYGSYWELYWNAWQADVYFMWVLHEAQYDYTLTTITAGPGPCIFKGNGNTFKIVGPESGGVVPIPGITLADYQGKGPYVLSDPYGNKVPDEWIGEPVSDAPLHRVLGNASRPGVYQPIYDYSHGVPVFSGQWRLSYYQANFDRIDPSKGAGIPGFVALLLRAAKKSIGWGPAIVLAADQAIRTADALVVAVVSEPPKMQQTGPGTWVPAPYSNFWAKPNPNGLQYPGPP